MVVKRPRPEAGVSLFELLIAISLSTLIVLMALALFRDLGFAARIIGGKRDAAFEARTALGSLAGNIMAGQGILKLAPDGVLLLNRAGRPIDYAWRDSALSANGVPYGFPVASFRLEAQGPRKPDWKAFSGVRPWALDSLDEDGDGGIDGAELDRDGDGKLDARELRFVASVRIILIADHRGTPLEMTCLVHPRNRIPDSASAAGVSDPFPAIPAP